MALVATVKHRQKRALFHHQEITFDIRTYIYLRTVSPVRRKRKTMPRR